MNSKTNHPINVGRPRREPSSAIPTTFQLVAMGDFVKQLGPVGRGFFMLLILMLVASASIAPLFPSRVTPTSSSMDVFSGSRAMTHLPIIAREPHPVGSPAQVRVRDYLVQELTKSGLEVQVQQTAGLENVVARLRGIDPTGAVIILTHYDTVPSTPGAGDNGAAVSALLEIMRALAAGPAPRNDVIALFDDKEEIGPFSGTKAFIREHPWMSDVRVAISIDSAVAGFISANEVGPNNNGWLVHVLARAYTGGAWMSMSGGGVYNSTPFREKGIPVLALESNYPFREYHTAEDLPEIIHPATVQQMGEQTVAITRELGNIDLANPWGKQETFFPVPLPRLFVHYPEDWGVPLAITAGTLLVLALGLSRWNKLISWHELGVAFGTILVTAVLAIIGVGAIQPRLPGIFGWQTAHWIDWPEVIPPNGWLAVAIINLLVLALAVAGYLLARHWSRRENFSLIGLLPFAIAAVALAFAQPRAAYAFIWPVLIGSLAWLTAALAGRRQADWSLELASLVTALPLILFFMPFLPGIVMSDGMKSLNILAGIEAALLGVLLPVVDNLLVRRPARR